MLYLKAIVFEMLGMKINVISIKKLPGYVLEKFDINSGSNAATIAPPTGTIKFLSVLCTNISTLPFLKIIKLAYKTIHDVIYE